MKPLPHRSSADSKPLALAVLISGGGTTLKNLIDKIAAGELHAEIRLVISTRPDAGGLMFAKEAGLATRIVSRGGHSTAEAFRDAIFQPCREAGVEVTAMGGFLKHVLIPDDFAGRVTNIHPSLIPAFCGHGYYGRRVHEAVLAHGAKVSGCTVHFVDNEFDHGPIILQKAVRVLDNDTPDTLAARVFEQECLAYPQALRLIAGGEIEIHGRRVLRAGVRPYGQATAPPAEMDRQAARKPRSPA